MRKRRSTPPWVPQFVYVDRKRVDLTDTDRCMLALLSDAPLRPGYLGSVLWPSKRRTPSAFARPAGKVLARLKRFGLATWVVRGEVHGWIKSGGAR